MTRRNSRISEDAKVEKIPIENDDEEDTSCGIGSWRPEWLQFFASAKFFVINFCIVGILQGAMFTYFVGIMSTIEKRFAFETTISGFILIADNLSQMVVSPVVGFMGTKYNRSHLIAIGELIVALSCLMTAIPYFIYGPGVHLLSKQIANQTVINYDLCSDKDPENCIDGGHSTVMLAVVILWLGSFANGLGYTAFYTVGLPYIDDNIAKKNSAMYLSTISTLRLLGPALGFVLSSVCLSLYEDPFMDPGITRKDPRWVGAWWLGFIILGIAIIICTIPMFLFPKKFKDMNSTKVSEDKVVKSSEFGNAKQALKRLSTNYLLIFHVFGGVFRIMGYLGYYIIKPKYMELQYRQSASSASLYTGATSVLTMAVGTMAGGIFIRYIKPSARYIAIFVCFVEIFSGLGIFSAMFLECPTPQYSNLPLLSGTTGSCSADCECTTKVFQPVCGSDGVTNYFSPCFAGCKSFNETFKQFNDCSCTSLNQQNQQSSILQNLGSWASNGLCARDCNMFPIFITVLSVCNFVASSARTGDTLLTLRSVETRDKSFAMGVMGSIFAVFAFIPYPLIFGAIIDSTCLVWEKSCGKTGNCWLYDIDKFRVYFHSSACAFILIGIVFEIGTVIMAGRIKNMYDEGDVDITDKPQELKEVKKKPEIEYKNNDAHQSENNNQVDTNGATTVP